MGGRLCLQQFGVARKVHTRRMERLLVQRRRHQTRHFAPQRGTRCPDHALRGRAARVSRQDTKRRRPRQPWQHQHRHATWRRGQRFFRARYQCHGQAGPPRPGDALRGAAQGVQLAHHKTPLHVLRRIAEGFGNDLRADTGRISLGDGECLHDKY